MIQCLAARVKFIRIGKYSHRATSLALALTVFAFFHAPNTGLAQQDTDETQQDSPADGDWVYNFYGEIDRGILISNDGGETIVYPFVDNSKSSSNLGVTLDKKLANGWHAQARAEVGLYWKSTRAVSQLDQNDSTYKFDKQALRYLEMTFQHDRYGTFYLGQGAMASDGVTSQDLSLTTVVAGVGVSNMASAQFFRETDGTLSSIRIVSRFRNFGSSRRMRIRYETPTVNNLTYSVAVGKEVLLEIDGRYYADASVKYDAVIGDFRYKAAAAIRLIGGYPDTNYRKRETNLIASASILHRPSRWNLTVASGVSNESSYYLYSKIGRRWYDLLPYGWTAASVDFYHYHDGVVPGGQGDSIGVAVVQKFKKQNVDLYASLRQYMYDDDSADYLNNLSFLAGFRWEF